jgi:hypothetical protein
VAVTLTSPALGHDVGFVYSGPEEDWLLASGYARRDGYTGPGVSNTGLTDVLPAKDPELAVNREPAPSHEADGDEDPGVKDPAMVYPGDTPEVLEPEDSYDYDPGGVNNDV